jgi:hypothetical protein
MLRQLVVISGLTAFGVTALLTIPLASVARADDEDAKALLAKGQDCEKDKPTEAAILYKRLLDKFPNDPLVARAHLRFGLLLVKMGKSEDARAHLREAHKLGKDDDEVQREAEQALISLPPPPEPKKEQPAAPAPAPAPKPATPPAPPPLSPEQQEIQKLEQEKRDLIKKAQDLEDQGKISEAYQVRAKVDEKVAEIERKKKALAGNNQKPQAKPQTQDQKKQPGNSNPKQRRQELEGQARLALQRGIEATQQNRPHDAAVAFAEHQRIRHELDQMSGKGGKKAELQGDLEKAKAKVSAAEKAGDQNALKAAREEVAQAEKALKDLDQDDLSAQLARLEADMKKRGAPAFEITERLAIARLEIELDQEHARDIAKLQQEIDEKKLPEPESKERMGKLNQEHRRRVDRLREDGEHRVHQAGMRELEKELAHRTEELKKDGLSQAEIDQKIAALKKELVAKLPGKPEGGGPKLGETSGEIENPREKRIRELNEENKRLKKRIEDLEKEIANLKAQKGTEATANAPK